MHAYLLVSLVLVLVFFLLLLLLFLLLLLLLLFPAAPAPVLAPTPTRLWRTTVSPIFQSPVVVEPFRRALEAASDIAATLNLTAIATAAATSARGRPVTALPAAVVARASPGR